MNTPANYKSLSQAWSPDLTFTHASADTSFNAELKGRRDCGHGYVYV
jgi:hypothetical protein